MWAVASLTCRISSQTEGRFMTVIDFPRPVSVAACSVLWAFIYSPLGHILPLPCSDRNQRPRSRCAKHCAKNTNTRAQRISALKCFHTELVTAVSVRLHLHCAYKKIHENTFLKPWFIITVIIMRTWHFLNALTLWNNIDIT